MGEVEVWTSPVASSRPWRGVSAVGWQHLVCQSPLQVLPAVSAPHPRLRLLQPHGHSLFPNFISAVPSLWGGTGLGAGGTSRVGLCAETRG